MVKKTHYIIYDIMGFLCLEDGASGPLGRVDHWRVKKVAGFPQKPQMSGASGPLGRVDHWRAKKVADCLKNATKTQSQWTTFQSRPLAQRQQKRV